MESNYEKCGAERTPTQRILPWYGPYYCGRPMNVRAFYPTPHFSYGYYTRNAPFNPQPYQNLAVGGHTAVPPYNAQRDPTLNYYQCE